MESNELIKDANKQNDMIKEMFSRQWNEEMLDFFFRKCCFRIYPLERKLKWICYNSYKLLKLVEIIIDLICKIRSYKLVKTKGLNHCWAILLGIEYQLKLNVVK